MAALLGNKGPSPSTLLAAFVLSVCFFSTEAFYKRTNITVDPPNPMEGGSVRLIPLTSPRDMVTCRWFRGGTDRNSTIVVFFFYPRPVSRNRTSYTGRETLNANCTLEITDLNVNDTANYTILQESPFGSRLGTVELVISVPPPPQPGRGFSRSTMAGIILGCLGALVILGVVVLIVKRSSRPAIRTLAPVVTSSSTT
ncbi:carcinoembryonic antigen-related cell adhesion molecule 16-like [Anolis sagrei]|uniref:carcinoembryonic antigen-related cell adhesion molecule 16-like n=1 Tax=Anolis sagrei TaxID=38937 RepID=UPI00351FAB7E